MSGFSKISNTIIVVFVLSFLCFSGLTFFQIQQNIGEETEASLQQAREMLSVGFSPAELERVLSKSIHLSVERLNGRLAYPLVQAKTYSAGIGEFSFNTAEPIVVPVSENQYLLITPHEEAELIQNMNFFYLVAALFFTTLGLLLFSMRVAIKHRLKPLRELAVGLQNLTEGKHDADLAKGGMEEVRQVIGRFLELQRTLEYKDQQLIKIDQKLAMLQEQERMYLAQELHDNVGQLLTTIKAHAYILTHATEQAVISSSAEKVQSFSQNISDAIRHLTLHLHPLTLDKVSLQESLQKLIFDLEQAHREIKWRVSINLSKYTSLKERDIHIYRFVQEAVNNVVKHANASEVYVEVYGDQHSLRILVKDNGVGFSLDMTESIGLSSMRSRARCIGAQCKIVSAPEGGVEVGLEAELDEDNNNSHIAEAAA